MGFNKSYTLFSVILLSIMIESLVSLDISKIVYNVNQLNRGSHNKNNLAHLVKNIMNTQSLGSLSLTNSLIHFETSLEDNAFEDLQSLINVLIEQQNVSNPVLKLLVSIRQATNSSERIILMKDKLLKLITNNIKICDGVSIEVTEIQTSCLDDTNCTSLVTNATAELEQKLESFIFPQESKIKVGYVYVVDGEESLINLHKDNIENADYLIVKISLDRDANRTIGSYGIFKSILKKKLQNIVNQQPEKTVYYQTTSIFFGNEENKTSWLLTIPKSIGRGTAWESTSELNETVAELLNINQTVATRYGRLLTEYMLEWSSHQNNTSVILKCPTKLSNSIDRVNQTTYMKNYIPYISISKVRNSSFSTRNVLNDVINSGFQMIMVDTAKFEAVGGNELTYLAEDISRGEKQNRIRLQKDEIRLYLNKDNFTLYDFLFIYHVYNESDISPSYSSPNSLHLYREDVTGGKINTVLAACADEDKLKLQFKQKRNISSCFNFQNFFEWRSANQSNTTTKLVWKGILKVSGNDIDNIDEFLERTVNRWYPFVIAKQILLKYYPAIQFVLHLKIQQSAKIESVIYCNTKADKISQLYETILTWAKLREIDVILEPIDMENSGNLLAWEKLTSKNSSDLTELMESHPVLIRRRYNQTKSFGTWLQGTYPCLQKSFDNSSVKLVNFQNNFVGVTLDFKIGRDLDDLSENEVQTLVLIVLKKFQNIYISVNLENIHLLKYLVSSSSFPNKLKNNKIKGNSLYLQSQRLTTNKELELQKYAKDLQKLELNAWLMKSISMSSPTEKIDKMFHGITPDDCVKLAEKLLKNDSNEIQAHLQKISYIICDTEEIPADTKDDDKIKSFLNAHLYLSKTFQYFYPSLKEIRFRLKPVFPKENFESRFENLLFFLTDVSNYAKDYKIHYFLLPAFSKENDNHTSFWTITNYTKLDNTSVYQDIQSQYLELPTWKPNLTTVGQESLKNNQNSGIISYAGTGTILASAIAILIVVTLVIAGMTYKFRHRKKHLSQKHVDDFMKGRQDAMELAESQNICGNIFDRLVYQKEYELSDISDTNLETIISNGKYSTVYRTKLQGGEEDVAVKIPKEKCSTEIFKGFLSEAKLLCYIGDHQNLIRFIGCYSQELRERVLWIVTEYYSKCLLEHLKGLKLLKKEEWGTQQLTRFAGEIASGMEFITGQNAIHGGLCAKKLTEYRVYLKNNQYEKLPWQWMAPEAVGKLEFSEKSDVWSYGITLWEIYSLGDDPYPGVTSIARLISDVEEGTRMECPPLATKEIFDVILHCWEKNPDDRPGFNKLVEYFTDKQPQRKCIGKEDSTTKLSCSSLVTEIVHE